MIKGNYKKLGEVCDFVGGSQPPKSNFVYDLNGLDSDQYVRLIQIRDYKSNNHIVYVPRSMAKKFCSKDDVMIGRYGPPLFQILRGLEGAYNVALMKAVPKKTDQLDQNYLFLFLQSPDVQGYVINLSERAAGQTGVNKPALYNYPILLPPIQEQKRIVSILDQAFADIEKIRVNTEKNLKNAREFFESYLHQVFTTNQVTWDKSELSKHIKFIDYRGKTPPKADSGIRLITAKNVRMGFIKRDPVEYIDADLYEQWMTRGIPKKGDVLFTTEAPLANVAQLDTDELVVFAQRIIIMQPDQTIIEAEFLKYLLISKPIQTLIHDKGTGATATGIKASLLKKIPIRYPKSIDEQKKIVEGINKINYSVQNIENICITKLDKLDQLKKSLLHQAFNGQLTKQEVAA